MTRVPSLRALAVLALVTLGLETAAVARDASDVAGPLVVAAGAWFQGLWAVLAWRAPRRGVIAAGLVANGVVLALSAAHLAGSGGRPIAPPDLLATIFVALLVGGLVALLVADGNPAASGPGSGGRRVPVATGMVALALAAVSLAAPVPTIAPPGTLSPIVGTASRPTTATPAPVRPSAVAPSPAGSPTPPRLAAASPGATGTAGPAVSPDPTAGDASPADAPSGNPGASAEPAATPASPGASPTPASPAAAGSPAAPTPAPTRASAAPTPAPAATRVPPSPPSVPSAHPTAQPTPAATPARTPPPTPSPVHAPPSATPPPLPSSPPPATVAPGIPGTITFGTGYDSSLAITGRTSTVHAGELVAWRADLSEPAGSTTLTFTITQPNPNGPEFPHWQQDFAVPDPSYVVIVNRVDLSVYVHGEPGTFIMRIRRGATGQVLAEGRFSLVP